MVVSNQYHPHPLAAAQKVEIEFEASHIDRTVTHRAANCARCAEYQNTIWKRATVLAVSSAFSVRWPWRLLHNEPAHRTQPDMEQAYLNE